MKFELTSISTEINGFRVFRIKALKDFSDVKKGDTGGWVEKEQNLSQNGEAWISGEAAVYGNAWVFGNARVTGSARVSGNALISGDARVSGHARVTGNTRISGKERTGFSHT